MVDYKWPDNWEPSIETPKTIKEWQDLYLQNPDPCMHMACSQCQGTGRKKDDSFCVHMISCPCPKCTPR